MNERLNYYRKIFKTLLIKEFLNLSFKDQEKFMLIADKFVTDCKTLHKEAQEIKEKTIIVSVLSVDSGEDSHTITGRCNGDAIKMNIPKWMKKPIPGGTVSCPVFSNDGDIWYSSKEELIMRGQ